MRDEPVQPCKAAMKKLNSGWMFLSQRLAEFDEYMTNSRIFNTYIKAWNSQANVNGMLIHIPFTNDRRGAGKIRGHAPEDAERG